MSEVSVVISAYNAERSIASCLQSALNQTYKTLEVPVVCHIIISTSRMHGISVLEFFKRFFSPFNTMFICTYTTVGQHR